MHPSELFELSIESWKVNRNIFNEMVSNRELNRLAVKSCGETSSRAWPRCSPTRRERVIERAAAEGRKARRVEAFPFPLPPDTRGESVKLIKFPKNFYNTRGLPVPRMLKYISRAGNLRLSFPPIGGISCPIPL